jgi:hypothetical protein
MATITIEIEVGEVVALTVANLSPDYDDPDPDEDDVPEEVKPGLVRAIGGKAS